VSSAERPAARSDAASPRAAALGEAARQRALRAGYSGRPTAALGHARAGLRHLSWTEDGGPPDAEQLHPAHHALAARLMTILAAYESEQGRTGYGMRLLDRAAVLAAAEQHGLLFLQRGWIFLRTGREEDALAMFDRAVILLERDPAETANLTAALLNRSFTYLNAGDVRRARLDLTWLQQVAADSGDDLVAAEAQHNLGFCELLAGDIPAALQCFDAAAGTYRRIAPGNLPILAMDKARALLAAGLAGDAGSELDGALAAFRRQRLDHDLAQAELARAEAALAAGDPASARRWAAAARRRFLRHGNGAYACLAELARLRARSDTAARPALVAAEAAQLAGRLRDLGLARDAAVADLLAARALLAAGRLEEARGMLASRQQRLSPPAPLAGRLLRRLARAELAEREGRSGAALAEVRAGLALVQSRRGRLGSVDLQTGTGALGADLAATGLRLALERDSAPLVFAWLERSRAQAFRVRPVRPPADPQAAQALAELRQLSSLIREAELKGRRDPRRAARQAELQREIRERDWLASGDGQAVAQVSLGEVRAALEESGQSLVSFLSRRGQLAAVLVRRGSVRLVELGDLATAAEATRRLNADLDTLAGRLLPARLEAVIRESVRHQAQILTNEITGPLRPWLAGEGVVLIPAGPLASIPWSLLPDLRGRPVTVSPSASAWRTAWLSGQAAAGPAGPVPPLLVAGPDLEHADQEVAEIARCYPAARPLSGPQATVGAILRALDGAPLAHLAAHGHHERENFLFSRLDLADGPLMAYDIQRLAAAPRQVILSSCDVGRLVTRPGEEVLGFTAALLYSGTATVISSVTRVADASAVSLMTAYHRLLAGGARPAEALAAAALTEPACPFVCFGSG
jgi:CHAT domain-containing protein